GTMCIAVAATGVEGLETIIPEAGISNWYDYYREGGLDVPPLEWQGDDIDLLAKYCFSRAKDPSDYAKVKDGYDRALAAMIKAKDRDSGNYNIFWDQRNYLNQIENFKASVFIIHGINDWNVKTNQCIPLFQALEKQGVERKMLLHQGEHVYVYDLEGSGTLSMVERWLDHYLRGADNGIEKEPKVLVESNVDQMQWMTSDTWPPEGWGYETFPVSYREGSEGLEGSESSVASEVTIIDDLSATVYDKAADNQKEWRDELILSEDPTYRNRLKLIWDPFDGAAEADTLRVAGSVKVAFDAAIDRGTAILSAMLVDLGEDCRITAEQVPAAGCSDAAKEDQAVLTELFRFGLEETPSKYKVISRGHLNAQNRTCLWSKEEIRPGQYYHYAFDMVPTDHTLKKGHKLGLILYGIDAEQTLRPDTVTKITVKPESIDVKVPVVR
ncbi:MAG: CocE/NonD family hydrolase, partial [Firmicutes bacterium]|nr:CocE/NonD family hydrolase [Bacillota bacterium]